MIGLFLGVSEFSEAFTVKRRVEIAANTSADLVARVKTVSTADLDGIKSMIDEILKPYPDTKLGLTITSVVADATNTARVAWSYAHGHGVSPHTTGTILSLPAGLTEAESSVILTEVKYAFQSTLTTMIVGDVMFETQAYLRPRVAAQVARTN